MSQRQSYAFVHKGRMRLVWERVTDWLMHDLLRWPRLRAARHVVPQGYVVLYDFPSHTFHECEMADRHNTALYDRRRQFVQDAGPDISCMGVEPPPRPNNVDRYQTWELENKPVSADAQAVAVETLLAQSDPIEFAPHTAVETVRDRQLRPVPDDSPASALALGDANARAGPVYKIFPDAELLNMTRRQCQAADRDNNRLYSKQSRKSRQSRERLGSVAHVHMNDPQHSRQSNYQRRIKLKARAVLVSAALQTEAVRYLYNNGMRLYIDYEPQNAISFMKQMQVTDLGQPPALSSLPAAADDAWAEDVPLPSTKRLYRPAAHT